MTTLQFAALAVRILALYYAVSALTIFGQAFLVLSYFLGFTSYDSSAFSYFHFSPQTYTIGDVVISSLPAFLSLGFGMLLWLFAEAIALMMVRENEESTALIPLDSVAIHVIAFSVTGIVLISKALPVAIQLIYDAFSAANNSYVTGITSLNGSQIFTAIAQTLLGLWLIFGAKGLVKSIRSLRDIGRDPNL